MRDTGPVTGREHLLPAGRTLVSVTDPKGRITYCNRAFVEASGYAAAELLGQPHNIVRHPDMPAEAFRDLWQTLEAGQPWTGLVKNRRKNGDHYWVLAHATPMTDGGRVTGFLSVRTPAPREALEATEALHARMREEARSGRLKTVLRAGRLARHGWRGKLGRLLRPSPEALVALLPAACVGVALLAMHALPPLAAVPLALLAALAASLLWQRQVLGPLKALTADAVALGAGDLSHPVGGGAHGVIGTLQRSLNQLALNLRTLVLDARADIDGLSGLVKEISAGNQDLSARTEQQASSLQQTAQAMTQITGTVALSADNAQRGAALAGQTVRIAEGSHDSVKAVARSMEEIHQSSSRIGDIIQVVESVAYQTNILALNAAVEAARAGEAGRGFAVVAAEVRSLARRTSEASREIRALIEASSARVAAGDAQTREAGLRMDDAVQSVDQLNAVLGEISRAAGQQRQGIAQINQAVNSLEGVTQQNAAMVEELAVTAQSMLEQVKMIGVSTRLFRVQPGEQTVAEMDAVELRRTFKVQTDVVTEPGQAFDFHAAIKAHGAWKQKLRNAVDTGERLDAAKIARDDCCPLGQWIHGQGRQQWGHRPNFQTLMQRHAVFHRAAAAVAEVANRGQSERAHQMLEGGTPFANATVAVLLAIRELEAENGSPTTAAA